MTDVDGEGEEMRLGWGWGVFVLRDEVNGGEQSLQTKRCWVEDPHLAWI